MRTAFGQEFDVRDGYLNTASIGVPPRAAVAAVDAAVRAWATGAAQPADFDDAVGAARAAYARLVGFEATDVALGGSTSALVGLVAAAVPDGARVIVARDEFTSVSFPFAVHAARGVSVTEVALDELPELAAEADVVAVSVVQSADGSMVDLSALCAATAATPTRVLLDATQAAGWLPLDLGWADAVVTAGYKWLMCPRGSAWLALSPGLRADLRPLAANWYAGADPWSSIYGLPLRLAPDARAHDASPAWWSHVGGAVTLPWLASLDRAAVQAHCVGLADRFLAGLGRPTQGSAIVSVDVADGLPRLAAAGVTASSRNGRVRLAFHLYSNDRDVDQALEALTG
ncbi:MAG: aminotransferase class V-fold PLP-dependent enzyme [Lapillicoccus sp.]